MSRFLNDDYKIKKQSVPAAQLSEDHFRNGLIQVLDKIAQHSGVKCKTKEELFEKAIPLLAKLPLLQQDFEKIRFRWTKVIPDEEHMFSSFQMTKSGVPFFGFYMMDTDDLFDSGDELADKLDFGQMEFYCALYFDENLNLRCYIPVRGNLIYQDEMCAIDDSCWDADETIIEYFHNYGQAIDDYPYDFKEMINELDQAFKPIPEQQAYINAEKDAEFRIKLSDERELL